MTGEGLKNILALFGFDATIPIAPLRESSDNEVFVVGDNDKKILRISKRLPVEDVAFECAAVNHLAQNRIPVPRFLPARSGRCYALNDGMIAVLFDFIEGHHSVVNKDHLPSAKQTFEAGGGLAMIHNAGADFKPASPRRRTILTELKRALALEKVFVDEFGGGRVFIDQVKSAIEFAESSREAAGLIQNDYRPGNVFFDNHDNLAGIIDFDWSCIGPFIKDTALGALEWSFPDGAAGPDFELLDSFLDGYSSIAERKFMRDRKLYDWIAFAALSDAATYFCDLAGDRNATKRTISSYMYRKYQFFKHEYAS